MNHFHNTNQESGTTLLKSESKCKSQEMEILKFMQETTSGYTVYELQQWFPEFKASSVGRAVTNLKNQRKIRKTGVMRIGGYGKQIHIYAVIKEYSQVELFK